MFVEGVSAPAPGLRCAPKRDQSGPVSVAVWFVEIVVVVRVVKVEVTRSYLPYNPLPNVL